MPLYANLLLQRGFLHVGTQHVLSSVPAGDAPEDNAIQQGIATQSVVAMDTSCNFSSGIEPTDAFPLCIHDQRIAIDLQTTHAVVDHRRDDSNVERLLRHCRPRNYVVVELLSRASFAARFIPRLARGVRREGPAIRILLCFLGSLVVVFMCLLQDRY